VVLCHGLLVENLCFLIFKQLKPLALDIIESTSVFDQTIDANLFYVELEWLKDVKESLKT
jgi:hypothetical protein